MEEAHFYAGGGSIYLHEYRFESGLIRSASSAAADADDIAAPRGRGSERGRELLCAVAAELNAYDWSRILPVTDDFVVYATDLELADLDRNMPACLPPSRLAMLRERGLL